MKNQISLCMIVKNEEHNLLSCLEGLDELVSEIIIVDTGSTDRTKEILLSPLSSLSQGKRELEESFPGMLKKSKNDKKIIPKPSIYVGAIPCGCPFRTAPPGVRVYETTWEDDFSKARNIALKHATKEWILILDADDRLEKKSFEEIKKVIEKKDILACFLQVRSYLEKDKYMITRLANLFRNRDDIFYEGIVHEQILGTIYEVMKKEPGWKIETLDKAVINHYGYSEEAIDYGKKAERNINLLNKALSEENLSTEKQLYYRINMMGTYKQQDLTEECKREGEEILSVLKSENSKSLYSQPVTSLLYSTMVDLYLEENNHDQAEKLIKEALLYFPGVPSFYYSMGCTLIKKKMFAEALTYFEKCIEFGKADKYNKFIPFDPGILNYLSLYMLAACGLKTGDIVRTHECLNKCLEYNSEFEPAKRLKKILK